jgi:hypothetical protein
MDPLHITEFASERYFEKLKQLNETPASDSSSAAPPQPLLQPFPEAPTFTLPLGNPRQRHAEHEPPSLKPSEQKKRSLGHDLTFLRTQRRPSFGGSFGSLRSKVNVVHKAPTIVEYREQILAEQDGHTQRSVSHLKIMSRNQNQLT